jgi:ribose transport system permease protein
MSINLGINFDLITFLIFAAVAVVGLVPMRLAGLRRESGMWVSLVALCFVLYSSNSDFLGQSNVINTTRQLSMLGIFAIGIAFVIITGGIDLSIGSVVGLTGVLIAKLTIPEESGGMGYSLWVSIPIALFVAMVIGFVQGSLITRLGLQPFIVTLGGMLLLRGISQTIVKGGTLSLGSSPLLKLTSGGLVASPPAFSGDLLSAPGLRYMAQNLLAVLTAYPTLIFILTVIIAAYVLHFTVFGRYVYAIGGNPEAAELGGVNVRRTIMMTFVLMGALCAISAVVVTARLNSALTSLGTANELDVIAAAVLGGTSLAGGIGTIPGAVLGAVVMQSLRSGMSLLGYSSTRQDVYVGLVLIAAVGLDAALRKRST